MAEILKDECDFLKAIKFEIITGTESLINNVTLRKLL